MSEETVAVAKHAAPGHPLRWLIATVVSLVVLAGIGYLVVNNPNLGIHKKAAAPPAASCQFYAKNVTVVVSGSASCKPLFQTLADDTETLWRGTTITTGEEFAKLRKGGQVVRIYEYGDKPFAGIVADWFQNMRWMPTPLQGRARPGLPCGRALFAPGNVTATGLA